MKSNVGALPSMKSFIGSPASSSGGGGLALQNIITGCDFHTGAFVQNKSIWVRFPHFAWTTLPATGKWKLRFRFSANPSGTKIGNMVIVRSNRYSNGVGLGTTFQAQVTIGGISNPVIAANTNNIDTDPIALTVVDGFDYWFIIFFINDAVNGTTAINNNANVGPMMGTTVITGDQTAAALTPAITDATPLTPAQVNLVTNVLAVP